MSQEAIGIDSGNEHGCDNVEVFYDAHEHLEDPHFGDDHMGELEVAGAIERKELADKLGAMLRSNEVQEVEGTESENLPGDTVVDTSSEDYIKNHKPLEGETYVQALRHRYRMYQSQCGQTWSAPLAQHGPATDAAEQPVANSEQGETASPPRKKRRRKRGKQANKDNHSAQDSQQPPAAQDSHPMPDSLPKSVQRRRSEVLCAKFGLLPHRFRLMRMFGIPAAFFNILYL